MDRDLNARRIACVRKMTLMNVHAPRIVREIIIPASLDRVWACLLSESQMKRWFNANAFEINVYEGGNIKIPLSFEGRSCVIEGEIALIVPKKKFEFTWIERNELGEAWFNNTMVRIELEARQADTKLILRHDGFKYLAPHIQEDAYQRYQVYWGQDTIFDRLKAEILENQP